MTREEIIKLAREAGFEPEIVLEGPHAPYAEEWLKNMQCFAALVAAAERKSKPHNLQPGEMELALRREHNGELFECRYRFTHLEVMNKAEFLVKEIARKLDVEMDRAIRARSQA